MTPTRLEAFLTENLREMGSREKAGSIQIQYVDQAKIQLGPRDAYRVRHEYTVGTATAQVAITQVTTLLILDGRGIAITAAGRTELFHPLADSVEKITGGARAPVDAASAQPGRPPSGEPGGRAKQAPMSTVEPIDLGRIGGTK
jgi:hypothetical protein